MTQRIDWEALGKAAGEAEKNRSWGLRAQRPKGWKPGRRLLPPGAVLDPTATTLQRSHASTRKFNRDRALGQKLNALLGTEDE